MSDYDLFFHCIVFVNFPGDIADPGELCTLSVNSLFFIQNFRCFTF